jgi:hypothetical protein
MLGEQTLGGGSQRPMPIESYRPSNGGNLANSRSQLGFTSNEQWRTSHALPYFELPSGIVHLSTSASRLSNLKRRTFAESGRAERIAKSLAAVNAAQPTQLSPSEWKRVAEADLEDQY